MKRKPLQVSLHARDASIVADAPWRRVTLKDKKNRMKKKPLQVSIHACEPSVVEVTVGDRVQLDRLTPSPHGYLAERLGRLLDPGLNTIALPPGHYSFKTLSDANLRVVSGGVTTGIAMGTKSSWPDPPLLSGGPALPAPLGAGDEVPGELPSFTIE